MASDDELQVLINADLGPLIDGIETVASDERQSLPDLAYLRDLVARGEGVSRALALDMLAEVEQQRVALEREHEDRTREYEMANADAEIAAKRIRELLAENATMRESNAKAAEAMRLLAEKANRAEVQNTAMRKMLKVMVSKDEDMHGSIIMCHYNCGATTTSLKDIPLGHAPDCPITELRTLLAQQAE